MAESPGSPLSSLSSVASSDLTEDVKLEDLEHGLDALPEHAAADVRHMPPAKRQKIGSGRGPYTSHRSTPLLHPQQQDEDLDDEISSDTSGDIPNSPPPLPPATISNGGSFASAAAAAAALQQQQDDDAHIEQVTYCKWRGCPAGELGNMDNLVQHLHDEHILARQKRYACEWEGCPRIDHSHASAYALRAHMRSHTREKPFYCALPGRVVTVSASLSSSPFSLCALSSSSSLWKKGFQSNPSLLELNLGFADPPLVDF